MSRTRGSLLWKLSLAFLLVAVTTAALVALFIRITSADRLSQLILDQQRSALQTELADYYTQHGSWQNIDSAWDQLRFRSAAAVLPMPTPGPQDQRFTPGPGFGAGRQVFRDRRRLFGLADGQGRVIVPVEPDFIQGQPVDTMTLQAGAPVLVDGARVGTILTTQFRPGLNPEENLFLQRTNDALIFAVLGASVIALIIGVVLARTLIRPLRALTQAAQNIAQGQLDQQVDVRTGDEIGMLGSAFNQMSQEVQRVNQLRRQMTADIAHDLRTPLTVIAGYVESMRDGVLQPTPERLEIIYTEIEHLQNLVGDLKVLSLADAGELPLHPSSVSPQAMLERAAAPFQHRAETQNITLQVRVDQSLPDVRVDEARMMQVFGNLLSNALRYTPERGEVCLSARQVDGKVLIDVEDSGAGIPQEDLPYIFDRFYRADKSRSTDSGETGLGLAIVKALVEAQGGEIHAESRVGEGTKIEIALAVGEI